MQNRKLEILSLATLTGALVIGAAACRQRTETPTAETAPAAGSITTTTTTTTTTAAELAQPAETAVITADPVVVSQRNATKRRAASQSRTTSGERPPREGRPGYSEERPAPPESTASHSTREVPAGTILRVAFDEPISTATANVGDTVRGRILDDVLAEDGTVVAASGSRAVGRIEHVVDSGKLARPAELKFRLTDLETRAGTVPIRTSTYERVGKTHTKRNIEYIAGGAAVGAIIGQVLGKDTESTLKGAAAGAAVGTGAAAATGDLDFTIEAGRTVAFTLEEPLRIR